MSCAAPTYLATLIYPNGITQALNLPNRPINNTVYVDKLTGDSWARLFYSERLGWWPQSSCATEGFIFTLSNHARSDFLLREFSGPALQHEFMTITNDIKDLL